MSPGQYSKFKGDLRYAAGSELGLELDAQRKKTKDAEAEEAASALANAAAKRQDSPMPECLRASAASNISSASASSGATHVSASNAQDVTITRERVEGFVVVGYRERSETFPDIPDDEVPDIE